MLTRFALPVVVLWIIALVLAFLPSTDFLGMSHHTYTGILFVAALVATVLLFSKANRNTLNGFAPLVLVVLHEATIPGWAFILAGLVVLWAWALLHKDEGTGDYGRGIGQALRLALAVVVTLSAGIGYGVAYWSR